MTRRKTRPNGRRRPRADPTTDHYRSLGFATAEEYRGWCRASGLDDALGKPKWRHEEEVCVRRTQRGEEAAKRFKRPQRRPAQVMLQLCRRAEKPATLRDAGRLFVEKRVTIEVRSVNGTVVQVRGRDNRRMDQSEAAVIRRWAAAAGLRVGRAA